MKNHLLLFLLLFIPLACGKENAASLKLYSKDTLNFSEKGGSATVNFDATDSWTAMVQGDDWGVIAPRSGSEGNRRITVSAGVNVITQQREAVLVVKCGSSQLSIKIIQAGASQEEDPDDGTPHASGYIKYDDGTPAVGVSVSDGFNTAWTNENGHYYVKTGKDTRYIYFSYPEDAVIERNSDGCPAFFKKYDPKEKRYDFTLKRQAVENDFVLFALADPQAHNSKRSPQTIADTDRFKGEVVPALNKQIAAQTLPCYAVTLGDIVYSEGSRNSTSGMTVMRSHFKNVNMPVFQTMGNHDYTYFYSTSGKELKTDETSSTLYLKAQRNFEDCFGPVNLSFNRGKVHVVCMRDVNYDSKTDASSYHGGFSPEQWKWFQDDLAQVPKSKSVILCVHIPICGITGKENVSNVVNLMKQYTNSAIFSGHTHYKRGYANILSSGIYEHIHSAVCGQWWWSNVEGDGCPNGYTVYTMSGTSIKDEYFIGTNTGFDNRECQIRMYRGNIKCGGAKQYFQLQHSANTLLINVFNGDSRWKSVKVYEDGVLSGNASLMSNSKKSYKTTSGGTTMVETASNQDWWAIGYNIGVVGRGIGTSTSYYTNEFHMYKYTLKSATSSVKVVATDPYGREYTCTELIEDGTKYPANVAVGNH